MTNTTSSSIKVKPRARWGLFRFIDSLSQETADGGY